MLKRLLLASLLAVSITSTAQATTHVISGTTILMYGDSVNGGGSYQAHAIYSITSLTGCNDSHSMYIDPADTTLYATALTGMINTKSIYIEYEDSPGASLTTNRGTLSCKVIAIWW